MAESTTTQAPLSGSILYHGQTRKFRAYSSDATGKRFLGAFHTWDAANNEILRDIKST